MWRRSERLNCVCVRFRHLNQSVGCTVPYWGTIPPFDCVLDYALILRLLPGSSHAADNLPFDCVLDYALILRQTILAADNLPFDCVLDYALIRHLVSV